MSTASKVVVVGCLVTVCVIGWFLCGALRDARRLLEVARAWETDALYDTIIGNIRHTLSLTRLIDTPKDPLYICGVPYSMTWLKLLPLIFNIRNRLECLEEQVGKARQEHWVFIHSFFHHLVVVAGVIVLAWLTKKILRLNHRKARNMNLSRYHEDNTQLTLVTERTRCREQYVFYSSVNSIVLFVFYQSQLNKIIVVAAPNPSSIGKIVSVSPAQPKANNRMITFTSSHAEIINVNTSSRQPNIVITVAASHPQQELIITSSTHDDKRHRKPEATTIHQVHYQDTKMTPNQTFRNKKGNIPQIKNNVSFNRIKRQVTERVVSDVLVEVVEDSHFPLKIVLEMMEELIDKSLMVAASKVVDDKAMNAKTRDVAEQETGNPASTGDVTKVEMEEAQKTVRRSLYLPPRYTDTIIGPNEEFLQYLRHTYSVTTGRNLVTSKLHIIGRKHNVLAAYASIKTRMNESKDKGKNSTSKSTQG